MFLVKFGPNKTDPIWPVDLFESQVDQAPQILGALLSDALSGFPVAYYPMCLQRAHENAALVDFDFDVLQDEVYRGIRRALGEHSGALDAFLLKVADPAQRRY